MINCIKKYWAIAVICLLCFWAVAALFHPGFFPMHDDEQIARLYDLDIAVKAGQIPPRWMQHLGFGFGFPLFIFYPPAVYYLGDILHTIGFSLIDSTKLVMGLGFLLSGIFMYLWVKNRFGVLAGIFAAVLYIYAPYHAVDLYVRGALAEFFSFVWLPAIFWTIDGITEAAKNRYSSERIPHSNNSKIKIKKITLPFFNEISFYTILAGIFFACLVITHNLIVIAFLPFLAIYLLYHLLISPNKKFLLSNTVYFILFGVGLSAFFWLPSLAEKQYTLVDKILTGELANYRLHFVYIRQFWNSPWGYGGSVPGPDDGLTFQIGKLHIVFSALVVIVSSVFYFIKKKKLDAGLPFIIGGLFIFSIFMASFYSQVIWGFIQPLWYLQFPWRFLTFSVLFSSFLGGYTINLIEKISNKNAAVVFTCIFTIIAIYSVVSDFQPLKYLPVTDANYTTSNDIEWRVSNMSYEYVPKGVATKLSDINTTQLAIEKKDIPLQPYQIVSGFGSISVFSNKPQEKIFIIREARNLVLRVNTFSFPGWLAFVDNQQKAYTDNNKLKLITITVPDGNHTVSVIFQQTPVEKIGNTISLISILILFLGIIYITRTKSKGEKLLK